MITIDKIYCINLDRRPDRWKQASFQFQQEKLQVERFPAVDGKDFKRKYFESNANNGCTLSHYFIIERAMFLGLNCIMVFEDDVELAPNFTRKLENCLNNTPFNWEMLYLGGSHREEPEHLNDHCYRVNRTLTTHGYLIRHSMYQLIIDNFKNLDEPVDCFFTKWQKDHEVFVTNPPLAFQRAGFSDIQERQMEYPWLRSNEQ